MEIVAGFGMKTFVSFGFKGYWLFLPENEN